MGAAHLRTAGAQPDEGGVTAAAVHRRARRQPQLRRGLRRQAPRHLRAVDDAGQVPLLHTVHPAQLAVPAFPPRAGVVQERGIGRIPGHHELPGAAADEIFLHIQPLVGFGEDLRFVALHPLVFPQRVLHTGGGGVCGRQTFQQHPGVDAGDGKAVGLAAAELLCGPLVHVAHGPAQGVSLPVHQHHALHLGAEGETSHLFRPHIRFAEQRLRRPAHGAPPLVGVLLGAAVFQNVQIVALVGAGCQLHCVSHRKKAGLDAGGAAVIGDYVLHGPAPFIALSMKRVISSAMRRSSRVSSDPQNSAMRCW